MTEAKTPAFNDPRTFVPHAYEERLADLGEIQMNYVEAGSPASPALLLIPGRRNRGGVMKARSRCWRRTSMSSL